MPRHDPIGVPLAHYLRDPDMGVRFECLACQDSFDVPTAEVIAKLKASGLGNERTGIRALARLATRPCRRCGAARWETRPVHRPRSPRKRNDRASG